MTTAETQLYLVVAAEVELEIKGLLKEVDRLNGMRKHKDIEKLPQTRRDLTKSCLTLLECIDDRMDAYKLLLGFIQEEQPPHWRVYA